jgi:hypothetical protein
MMKCLFLLPPHPAILLHLRIPPPSLMLRFLHIAGYPFVSLGDGRVVARSPARAVVVICFGDGGWDIVGGAGAEGIVKSRAGGRGDAAPGARV